MSLCSLSRQTSAKQIVSPSLVFRTLGVTCGKRPRLIDELALDYKFRELYFLSVAHEDERTTSEGSVTAIQGWVDCFPKAHLAGTIFAGGVDAPGEITGHKALQEAYKTGKSI